MAYWKCSYWDDYSQSRQKRLDRVQTTLRGSADDVGWQQNDPKFPPVVDKTDRFVQLLGRISRGVRVLPKDLVYLLIPGLFSNYGSLYFVEAKKYFSDMGLSCYIAQIHSEDAVETNARVLKEYIEELYRDNGKRIVVLGHSKGGIDGAAACAMYWPNLKDKVVGLVVAQSPYGGTPVASDFLREGQIAEFEIRRIVEFFMTKVVKGDMQALEDLTYEKRREFVARYPLPPELTTVSFHTEASTAGSDLVTLSHIAHVELSWLSGANTSNQISPGAKLSVVFPLQAAMAVCASHLYHRYGEKSDGVVTRRDAEVPGSVAVRPEKKLDHSWLVFTPSKKEAKDPNSSQMCEALFTLLLEEITDRQAASSRGDIPHLDGAPNSLESDPGTSSYEIKLGMEYLEKI